MSAGWIRTPAAATYGPTIGPPPGAPVGVTPSVDVSAMARPTLTRPLPSDPPLMGSAFRARRPTIVAFDAPGSAARRRAAAPPTTAAEAEVPVMLPFDVATPSPGAPRNTASPVLLPDQMESLTVVPPTPTTLESPAGDDGALEPSLPAAATTTMPLDHA